MDQTGHMPLPEDARSAFAVWRAALTHAAIRATLS